MASLEEKMFYQQLWAFTIGPATKAMKLFFEVKILNNSKFEHFLNDPANMHTLFHQCYPAVPCCKCLTLSLPMHEKRCSLNRKQFDILYDSFGERQQSHQIVKGSKIIRYCLCTYSAKCSIGVGGLDLTLFNEIVRCCCPFQMNYTWRKNIKDVRNYLAHTGNGQVSKDDFEDRWMTLKTATLGFAAHIGSVCEEMFADEISRIQCSSTNQLKEMLQKSHDNQIKMLKVFPELDMKSFQTDVEDIKLNLQHMVRTIADMKKEESSNEFLPAVPLNPEVLIENNDFILRWQSVFTAVKGIWSPVTYSIELSTDNGVNWLLHADGVKEFSVKLDILDYGIPYQLRVIAHNKFGCSEPTSPVKFHKDQPSTSSLNHNRLELIEKGNFFRAARLEDILCCSLKDVLKEELDRTYVSFENFINLHQHEIYHMCFSTKCCLCTAKSPKQYRKVLNKSHLGQLFDEDCVLSCHKNVGTSYCCCKAKEKISITVIDTYLTCVLLLNTCTNVFWHLCLDFQSVSLEELLNRNKHNLYHIWHGNTTCCQCNEEYMKKRRFSNDNLSKNHWKRLFSKRSIPCLLHTKNTSDELVCSVQASRHIQIVDLEYGLQKIILDNVCPIKEKIILVLKDVIDLYAYSKKGMIPCKPFTVIYDNLLRVITDITIIVPTENNNIGRIRNISKDLFDDQAYRITCMVFQKKHSSIQNLNLITDDECHSFENTQISTAKIENQGCNDRAIAECRWFNNEDQSQVCSNCHRNRSVPFTESKQIIKPETDRAIKSIRKEHCQQLLSLFCYVHAKKYDIFCISHQLPLCDDCMKMHVKCTVNQLKIVAKGVMNSNQFKNIERRMQGLFINMNDLLPKLESDIKVISDAKESFQKSIENSKNELTLMLDKVKEEGLQIIESNSIKMRFFHNKMSILNISVVEKMTEIAMSRRHSSESEIYVSLPRIEVDLQRFENRLFENLLAKEIIVFEPIVKLERFGELKIQVSYNPWKHMCQELPLILESYSVNMIQQIKDMRLDEGFGFEVPNEKEVIALTGCTFLTDGELIFVDSKSSRLILRSYDGINKYFHLLSIPLDITAISNSKVAILHRDSIAIFSISDKRMNIFTFKSGGTFRFVTFHNQNLIVCVSGCSFFIVTLQGQKIKEIDIDETLISCISCWNNNIFYANRDKNTIYGVNLHTGKQTLKIHVGGIVNSPSCIVSDGSGKLFVIGSEDDNMVAISVYGKEYKELVRGFKNTQKPTMIAYNSTQKRLLMCSPIGHYSVYTIGS